jgi:hypothetical protein
VLVCSIGVVLPFVANYESLAKLFQLSKNFLVQKKRLRFAYPKLVLECLGKKI